MKQSKILIGVSSCLLGENVRYDGKNKNNNLIVHEFSQYFEVKSFCPEVAIGLGVPREPIKLVKSKRGIACVGTLTASKDLTLKLEGCATTEQPWLDAICGYIFKARSPSCGLNDVNIYNDEAVTELGRGIFAKALSKKYPELPIIDEKTLADKEAKKAFIQDVQHYAKRKVL